MSSEKLAAGFDFELLGPDDAKLTYPSLWRTAAKSLPHLGDEDLAVIVSLAADTCQGCYAQHSDCSCSRGERTLVQGFAGSVFPS
jgi:hypothetical protein